MSSTRIISSSLLFILLLAGCQKTISPATEPEEESRIRAEVSMEGFTKAAVITAVPTFSLYGYVYDSSIGEPNYCFDEKIVMPSTWQKTTYISENKYSTVPSGKNVLLVGIAPYGAGGWTGPSGTGTPKISYTNPVQVSDQQDVIVASYSTSMGFNRTCTLAFGHVLSSLKFAFSQGGSFDGTIRSISLKDIYTEGVYDVIAGSWGSQDTKGTRTGSLNKAVTRTSKGAITTDAQTFMILPQTCPDDAVLEVVVNDGKSDRTITASLKGKTFAKGNTYTYNLDLSSLYKVYITVEGPLADWNILAEEKVTPEVLREEVVEVTSTQSVSVPSWAKYADLFLVNGGNGGTSGTSSSKTGKGGLGGRTLTQSDITLSGGSMSVTVGSAGTAGGGKGGQSKVVYSSRTYNPTAQVDNTGTGEGSNGTAAPEWVGSSDLFGASGGAGNSSSVRSGGTTGGGKGGKAGSSSSSVTNATAGTFYGAGGGGGYYNSSSRKASAAAGYKGIVYIHFRNQ